MSHILIIEDDVFIAEALTIILELEDYKDTACMLTAEDGLQAVALHTPDLVILDYMLPDHNGGWLLAEIAKLNLAKRPPVLLLTAGRSALAAYGDMAEFALSKPFDVDELLEAVERLLAGELTMVESGCPA